MGARSLHQFVVSLLASPRDVTHQVLLQYASGSLPLILQGAQVVLSYIISLALSLHSFLRLVLTESFAENCTEGSLITDHFSEALVRCQVRDQHLGHDF